MTATGAQDARRTGILLVFGAALLWSTGGLGIKALADPPLKVAFFRSAVAAVALLLYFRPRLFRPTLGFLAAVASYAACLITFVVATKWTSAANAIFLQYSGVVWVLLFSPLTRAYRKATQHAPRLDTQLLACLFLPPRFDHLQLGQRVIFVAGQVEDKVLGRQPALRRRI